MMLDPFTVNVLGTTFTVRSAEPGELQNDTAGMVLVSVGLILYDGSQCEDEIRETIFHELLHAVDEKTAGGRPLGEKRVSRLSATLYATLVNNPEVAGYLIYGVMEEPDADLSDEV